MIRNTSNSPYLSITGCALLYDEFKRVLLLMMADNAEELLKEELIGNHVLQVNSQTSRSRFLVEFRRRYQVMPVNFWCDFLEMNEEAQRAALFFVILKTYKLVFDIHFNLTVCRWRATDTRLDKADIVGAIEDIATRDEFVDSWSETTKARCASQYLTILRQAGILEVKGKENILRPLRLDASDFAYYFRKGDDWFLEACLLFSYEINELKTQLP